ncbi:MAG: outer membrane lipoprotein-sorting protein [Candidatus Marinimicrobia bacterium]|jgi:outer membrane lipoprotein-sorting protein|nr:outer membrane lipoprotein-sorting protein [Candidatus Neomarinimicrobiota bacterium]|tara:strand:- start:5466 stop:6197 length:732 start_codon:yes stop_codon:yes gene_type:complete
MRYKIVFILISIVISSDISVDEIINKIDFNLNSKNRVITSEMIVHGRRTSRNIVSKSWIIGTDRAFTEYLSPPREEGSKMLKLDDVLLTYSPQTDRIIQISGHMLRQSIMGSDMSYNDVMEDKPLEQLYTAIFEGEEIINDRKCYVLFLESKSEGISYPKRREWVDAEYFLPVKEELYAKSGKLLKSTSMDGIKKIGERWFPTRFIFKDELKKNSRGTEWIITDIQFDQDIPDVIFSKSNLRK